MSVLTRWIKFIVSHWIVCQDQRENCTNCTAERKPLIFVIISWVGLFLSLARWREAERIFNQSSLKLPWTIKSIFHQFSLMEPPDSYTTECCACVHKCRKYKRFRHEHKPVFLREMLGVLQKVFFGLRTGQRHEICGDLWLEGRLKKRTHYIWSRIFL